MTHQPILPGDVTGLVLAGGFGTRMGGVDKGLQNVRGMPIALHALRRLQAQQGGWVGNTLVNANRHLATYQTFGAPVWPDTLAPGVGPLAGFLTGMAHAPTPWLLTVPCDSPWFPMDLAERLAEAANRECADIAMAATRDEDGTTRKQPVFCLLRVSLMPNLIKFTSEGGRKVDGWTSQHPTVLVPFDLPNDDRSPFFNANTFAELQTLET